MRVIEWQAKQTCGQCGTGEFHRTNELLLCTDCGHEHTLDDWNLGYGEEFTLLDGVLYVTAYETAGAES